LRKLTSSGVLKGSRTWQPDVSLADVVKEAGLVAVRGESASAQLEEFLPTEFAGGTANRNSLGGGAVSDAGNEGADASGSGSADKAEGEFNLYRFQAELGRGIWEMSVGYPLMALSYWVGA